MRVFLNSFHLVALKRAVGLDFFFFLLCSFSPLFNVHRARLVALLLLQASNFCGQVIADLVAIPLLDDQLLWPRVADVPVSASKVSHPLTPMPGGIVTMLEPMAPFLDHFSNGIALIAEMHFHHQPPIDSR